MTHPDVMLGSSLDTAKVSEPPPRNFRELCHGAALAECLMVTGAWAEFDALLAREPGLCATVLAWVNTDPTDTEYVALVEGKRRARAIRAAE